MPAAGFDPIGLPHGQVDRCWSTSVKLEPNLETPGRFGARFGRNRGPACGNVSVFGASVQRPPRRRVFQYFLAASGALLGGSGRLRSAGFGPISTKLDPDSAKGRLPTGVGPTSANIGFGIPRPLFVRHGQGGVQILPARTREQPWRRFPRDRGRVSAKRGGPAG